MEDRPAECFISKEEEIEQIEMGRPHVVFIGAGASLASFPNGDRNGIRLPLMNNLAEVLGLSDLFHIAGIDSTGQNFEEIFDQLYRNGKYSVLRQEIEDAIRSYFNTLRLPDHPTIYDHLILSLRAKDIIATFNWDPFLTQAYIRNMKRFKLPRLQFLHGNVTIGYCARDRVLGVTGNICNRCGMRFTPSKLLYPISKKNYHHDGFISEQWKEIENAMKNAFMITIFGYRAPKSDVSAVDLLKSGWDDKYAGNMQATEIIDNGEENDLNATWYPFIQNHHYEIHKSFYDSWIANHPRRTGEAYLNHFLWDRFIEDNPIPRDADFPALWYWFDKLSEAEKRQSA